MTTDEKYWADYDGLQLAKHAILKRYLGGWFPILTSAYKRVLYIDCHAGRGRHDTGQEGSPIIALRGLLKHKNIEDIIRRANVIFLFFERDEYNYQRLLNEINSFGGIPQSIKVMPYCSDYGPALRHICNDLKERDEVLAPCFAFLDPYGFDLSMDLMNTLLSFPQSEIFITFMFRWVDMAIQNGTQDENMRRLFGCDDWKLARGINDYKSREEAILKVFSNQLNSKYVTYMHMLSASNTVKYILIHATNHPSGRNLMKETMWGVSPEGSFKSSERDNPNQFVLLHAEPDLTPLTNKMTFKFSGESLRIDDLYDWLIGEIYLKKHLHTALMECKNNGIVEFSDYEGRLAFKKNPLVSFN